MNIKTGKNPPEEVNVVIEIPKGSNIKYEVDHTTGMVMVDRFLHTAMYFPANYGFIPNTLADDGDPSDVLVLCEQVIVPGAAIPAHIIGMLEMEDEAGIDTKLLAVPTEKIDPLFGTWKDIDDVPEAMKNKMRHFFENYKSLEPGKWVKLKEWKNKATALEIVQKSIDAVKA